MGVGANTAYKNKRDSNGIQARIMSMKKLIGMRLKNKHRCKANKGIEINKNIMRACNR